MRLEPGSISTGTLLNSDLIIAFWDTLESLEVQGFNVDMYNIRREASDIYAMAHDNPDDVNYPGVPDETHNQDMYESAVWLIHERLIPELESVAADNGLEFGTHPGDGADFGFWEPEGE